jgi:hypothetical protein
VLATPDSDPAHPGTRVTLRGLHDAGVSGFRAFLSPFGVARDNEVYHAADHPHGVIQATVFHDDAPDPGPAWDSYTGLVSVRRFVTSLHVR